MRNILAGCILLLCTGSVMAQMPAETLTLDMAIERALSQSITIKKSAIDLATAAYSANHTWSEFFPTITANASVSYPSGNNSSLFSNGGLKNATPGYSLSAGIKLQLSAGIPTAIELIKLAYKQQTLTYESACKQMEIQIIKAFYSLLAVKENLNDLEKKLALSERQLVWIKAAFDAGTTGELSYLQSQLAVETDRASVHTARAGYNADMGSFLVLLGMDPALEVNLLGELVVKQIVVDPDQLIYEHLATRSDIKAQQQALERQELTKKQSDWNAYAPSLTLSWTPTVNQSGFTDPLSASIGVSIPINTWIPGTKENQAQRLVQSKLEQAQLDLKDTEQKAALEIRRLAAILNNSWESLENIRLQERIAQRTYEVMERDFNAGTIGSSSMEDARQKVYDAEYRLLSAELSYWNTMLDLAAAINVDWKTLAGVL